MSRRREPRERQNPVQSQDQIAWIVSKTPAYPRDRARHEGWELLESRGHSWGDLQKLLNDDPNAGAPVGAKLLEAYNDHGWLGVQELLIARVAAHARHSSRKPSRSTEKENVSWAALHESALFVHHGFRIMRCDYGGHWYVSGDPRRRECPRHAIAGQRKRVRMHRPVGTDR